MNMLNENTKKTIKKIQKKKKINNGVRVHAETSTPVSVDDVLNAVKDLGEDRDYIIKTIMAVALSVFVEKSEPPIWLIIVGNPSSNKTTLLDLLASLEFIYRLDTMTSNPFSSGQREKEKPQDLLPLLNNKCFVIKEYGTIFGRSDEMVKQLISDLVAIYDGEYAKHSPTRGTVRYSSYFSHIGAVTPMALSQRQKYMSAIGARFLFLRVEPLCAEQKEKSLKGIWHKDNKRDKKAVAEIVCAYVLQLVKEIESRIEVGFSEVVQGRLNNFAHLMARARGIVISDKTVFQNDAGKSISHYETVDLQIEEPFRAVRQLRKMAYCLAIINGNTEVGDMELDIIKKIVLSSMEVRRADILSAFTLGNNLTARKGSELLGKNYKTVKRNFDELSALGVLVKKKDENDRAALYSLKEEFLEIFNPPKSSNFEQAQQLFSNDDLEDE
jgi:hypothetical protein